MNQADTAWMLVATALVLLMTPALGFFYGEIGDGRIFILPVIGSYKIRTGEMTS